MTQSRASSVSRVACTAHTVPRTSLLRPRLIYHCKPNRSTGHWGTYTARATGLGHRPSPSPSTGGDLRPEHVTSDRLHLFEKAISPVRQMEKKSLVLLTLGNAYSNRLICIRFYGTPQATPSHPPQATPSHPPQATPSHNYRGVYGNVSTGGTIVCYFSGVPYCTYQ